MTPTPQPSPDDRELAEKIYNEYDYQFRKWRKESVIITLEELIEKHTSPLRTALGEAQKYSVNNIVCIHHSDAERAANVPKCYICLNGQLSEAKKENEEHHDFMRAFEYLRQGIAESVTFHQDNQDPPPNVAITCNGEWTDWKDHRFEGASIKECLDMAVAEKEKAVSEAGG